MNAWERRNRIVNELKTNSSVEVEELASLLSVSSMTIRRDLTILEKEHRLERVHGGAILKNELSYKKKKTMYKEEKKEIAKKALVFIENNSFVFLDAGTTVYELAKLLDKFTNLVVCTTDLEIALLLKDSKHRVIVCGGDLQKETGSVLGEYTTNMVSDFRFELAFFGASSISDNNDVTTPSIAKVMLKRKIMENSKKNILLCDKSKFGKEAMFKICSIRDFDEVLC